MNPQVPESSDGGEWQQFQSLPRKGGQVSDALLRFGAFSQIQWWRFQHLTFHISPLTTDQQSVKERLLGKRGKTHLRAAVTTSSHRSRCCWGRQGTWHRDQPEEVSHSSSCSFSLPLGYLALHPTAGPYPHPPSLEHCPTNPFLRGVTGVKQHLSSMAKGQVLVPSACTYEGYSVSTHTEDLVS